MEFATILNALNPDSSTALNQCANFVYAICLEIFLDQSQLLCLVKNLS